MLNKLKIALVALIIVFPVFATLPVRAEDEAITPVVWLSEIQSGGLEDTVELPKAEFIELYNPADSDIDITGWRLEYLSSSHAGGADPTRLIADLEGYISPHSYVLLGYVDYIQDADLYFGAGSSLTSGLLAKSGGHVRLVDALGLVIDQVGWGSASAIGNWPRTSEIPPGFSIKRILPDDPLHELGQTFTLPTTPATPLGGGLIVPVPPEEIPVEEPTEEDPGTIEELPDTLTCEGVIINELLPNPAGTDDGNEFIELFNPTAEAIPLDGCELMTTANSKTFKLENITLQPGGYSALYNNQTGLTLPNSSGGTVWLLSSTEELQAITYDGGTPDDVAWALIDGIWEATYQPTPNELNILLASKPCPVGQIRNAVTNRCQNIAVPEAESLTPCQPGQERNPATNRCRSIFAAVATLVPCKEGQERNPDTNRCRSISTATALVPCADGQERNPETNRCRKVSSTQNQALTVVKDVNTGPTVNSPKWWLAGLAALAAISYGLYEWRHDLASIWEKLRKNLQLPSK